MKTTIELPDETYRRAKIFAAEHRTTLKDLMTRALEAVIEPSEIGLEKTRRANLERILTEMQAANTEPMQPLSREEAHER